MEQPKSFEAAIAACLTYSDTTPTDALITLVNKIINPRESPDRKTIDALAQEIHEHDPPNQGRIALVMGGATKIKEYVFESPKLPEIRGASALLDWVNIDQLPQIWHEELAPTFGKETTEACIIYAGGGGFLAFAPASKGQHLADRIEQTYTRETLTAQSVAVAHTFHLLELGYGRLHFDPNGRVTYWIDEFLRDWENPQRQHALQTYYHQPLGDDTPAKRFWNRKTFGELATYLAVKTQQRRGQHNAEPERIARTIPLLQLMPWATRCASSDLRPAVQLVKTATTAQPMSDASARKRVVGQRIKRDDATTNWYHENFEGWDGYQNTQLLAGSWEQQWEDYLDTTEEGCNSHYRQHSNDKGDIKPASDVEEIAQASNPSGYIGMIYADGNNVGRLIATIRSIVQYAQVSETLRNTATNTVFHALARHLQPKKVQPERGEPGYRHPFEIIAIGGDDILIIVPGSVALTIASTIGQQFERRMQQNLHDLGYHLPNVCSTKNMPGRYAHATPLIDEPFAPSIGLSAGILIAQETMPLFFARKLVEELLKNAKERAKTHAKNNFYSGAVDFMVLKSTTMVADDIGTFRKNALLRHSNQHLTARPYSWHEFAGLLNTVQKLREAAVPKSQLYNLRERLENEVMSSVLDYLYTRSRLDETPANALIHHIEHAWCQGPQFAHARKGLPPWQPRGTDEWETIWPDMLEIYDMAQENIDD